MKNVYDFFGIKKVGSFSDACRYFRLRMRVSIKNAGHPKTYNRYESKYGLHKNIL